MQEAITPRGTSGAVLETPPTRAGLMVASLEALLRPLAGPRGLLLYGLVAGLLCALALMVVAPRPFPLEGTRVDSLQGATIARMQGDALLTAVITSGPR